MSTTVPQQTHNGRIHPTEPVTGEWIHTNGLNPHTYKSSNIRAFRWSDEPEYEFGKLIVRFQGSGTYIYDLPEYVFEHMAKRAFNPDDYTMSTGEWYSNKFFSIAKDIYGYRDTYYEKKRKE